MNLFKYTEPLNIALSDFKSDHHSNHSFEDLNNIIWSVCESNMTVYKSDSKYKLKKKKTVPRLPQGVWNIKRELNAAFNQWKSESQPTDSVSYFHYRNKKAEYRQALRNFIVDKENEKITMLCDTLGVNEKQFWQMIKPKQTIRSGSHFILIGRVLRSDIDILDMWASHFENLGKPSTEPPL